MNAIAPVSVELIDGQATTTSLDVAAHFAKRHDDVLKRLRNLDCTPEFTLRNFAECSRRGSNNKPEPYYRMTRDGFTFLCMGFTGKEAAKWKEAYINAFNQLEQQVLTGLSGANTEGDLVDAADEDFIHLNYDRRALLVYRRGDSFWYRAGNIAALVGVATETIMRAAGGDVLRVKSGSSANSVVTMIGHRSMLASLGRLRRADADALLQWLKLLLPGAFALQAPALEAAPVATQPAALPAPSLHYPVEVLPQMNPHAYRPLPANAVDPRIVMPVRALCGMDSRSPTLDLLSKLTSAGFDMEGCRLEVLAMRGLLENYISISRDMARMWEHRADDCMVFKLSEAARQMRAKGGSRF